MYFNHNKKNKAKQLNPKAKIPVLLRRRKKKKSKNMALPKRTAKECCLEELLYQGESSLWYNPKVKHQAGS